MRRKDREMPKEFGLEIIDRSQYGVLSILNKGLPYQIPLSIVRDGESLYFHSAKAGEKIETFKESKDVSVTFVGKVEVPHLFTGSEVMELKKEGKIGEIISKVYTTEFESAIVKGKVFKVEDEEERKKALKLICDKYVPEMDFVFEDAFEKSKAAVEIFRIDMEEITAKRKKFGPDKKEIKSK